MATAVATSSARAPHPLVPKIVKSLPSLHDIVELAHSLVVEYMARRKKTDVPPIAVFDIDDTLLAAPPLTSSAVAVEPPPTSIQDIVELLHTLRRTYGFRVLLVTARLDAPDVRAWSVNQLRALGVHDDDYDALVLASEADRLTATTIGRFKARTRRSFATAQRGLIVLTVGDQWTDLVEIHHDGDLEALDRAMFDITKDLRAQYHLVRLVRSRSECDVDTTTGLVGCAGLWGLKLAVPSMATDARRLGGGHATADLESKVPDTLSALRSALRGGTSSSSVSPSAASAAPPDRLDRLLRSRLLLRESRRPTRWPLSDDDSDGSDGSDDSDDSERSGRFDDDDDDDVAEGGLGGGDESHEASVRVLDRLRSALRHDQRRQGPIDDWARRTRSDDDDEDAEADASRHSDRRSSDWSRRHGSSKTTAWLVAAAHA